MIGTSGGAAQSRFPGLDTLRFLAAMFVVICHIPLNQAALGLPNPNWGAFFYRGSTAVKLFFTLSGFLISFLLMEELKRTGTIDVKRFYLRRVCRIWPLYFLVAGFGLIFYNVALPRLGIAHEVGYDWRFASLLYLCFLPNLINSLYSVGGILNPLWSIGIEEQFYLSWAPAVRRLRNHLPALFLAVFSVSFAISLASLGGLFGAGVWKRFTEQLQFHYMASGALAAYAWRKHPQRLLTLPPFARRSVQWVLTLLLVEYYSLGLIPWGPVGEEILQLVLYPWLLLNVSVNPRSVIRFHSPTLEKLGTVSYGIYMLHMPVIYATSMLFRKTSWWRENTVGFVIGYYGVAILGTLFLAVASYRWFESPFLRLKDRRFSAGVDANRLGTRSLGEVGEGRGPD
jgi:peptidoglycan/LPS O-acetylase OafA/YrhL